MSQEKEVAKQKVPPGTLEPPVAPLASTSGRAPEVPLAPATSSAAAGNSIKSIKSAARGGMAEDRSEPPPPPKPPVQEVAPPKDDSSQPTPMSSMHAPPMTPAPEDPGAAAGAEVNMQAVEPAPAIRLVPEAEVQGVGTIAKDAVASAVASGSEKAVVEDSSAITATGHDTPEQKQQGVQPQIQEAHPMVCAEGQPRASAPPPQPVQLPVVPPSPQQQAMMLPPPLPPWPLQQQEPPLHPKPLTAEGARLQRRLLQKQQREQRARQQSQGQQSAEKRSRGRPSNVHFSDGKDGSDENFKGASGLWQSGSSGFFVDGPKPGREEGYDGGRGAHPFFTPGAPPGFDAFMASAVQQTAVIVAENMVRDSSVRAAAAEQRATAAESQLDDIREKAVTIMENVQNAANAKVTELETQLEQERAKVVAFERKFREMGPRLIHSASGGGAVPLGSAPKLVMPNSMMLQSPRPVGQMVPGTVPRGYAPGSTPTGMKIGAGPGLRLPLGYSSFNSRGTGGPYSGSPMGNAGGGRAPGSGMPGLPHGVGGSTGGGIEADNGRGTNDREGAPGAVEAGKEPENGTVKLRTPIVARGSEDFPEGLGGEGDCGAKAAGQNGVDEDDDEDGEATEDENDGEVETESEGEEPKRVKKVKRRVLPRDDDDEEEETEDEDEASKKKAAAKGKKQSRREGGEAQRDESSAGGSLDLLAEGVEKMKGLEDGKKGSKKKLVKSSKDQASGLEAQNAVRVGKSVSGSAEGRKGSKELPRAKSSGGGEGKISRSIKEEPLPSRGDAKGKRSSVTKEVRASEEEVNKKSQKKKSVGAIVRRGSDDTAENDEDGRARKGQGKASGDGHDGQRRRPSDNNVTSASPAKSSKEKGSFARAESTKGEGSKGSSKTDRKKAHLRDESTKGEASKTSRKGGDEKLGRSTSARLKVKRESEEDDVHGDAEGEERAASKKRKGTQDDAEAQEVAPGAGRASKRLTRPSSQRWSKDEYYY